MEARHNDFSGCSTSFLEKEARDEWALFTRPTVHSKDASIQAIARILLSHPGRYRSPLSWRERMLLQITARCPKLDPLRLGGNLYHSQVETLAALPWQVLLRYLRRERVITMTSSGQTYFRHDSPKGSVVRLRLNDIAGEGISGTGSNVSPEVALSKSIGETLERFFLAPTPVYKPKIAKWASIRELAAERTRFLHPRHLDQFKERLSFDEGFRWGWVSGARLGRQGKVLLPAQSVCFGRRFWGMRNESEPTLRDRNSNAAAGGFTLTEALASGVHEAIERDGFMIFWLNRIAPPVLDVSTCSDRDFQQLLDKVKRYRFEVVFLNITSDVGVPAVTCVLIDRGIKGPSICIGSSCGYDLPSMLKSALFEALSVQRGSEGKIEPLVLTDDYEPFIDRKIDLGRRVKLWKDPANFHRFEFFLSGSKQTLAEAFGESRNFATPEDELEYLRARLASMGPGYEIYYHEHRHRILDRIGYHVVKVIIPELVHLYLNEHMACLGAKRLRTVPPKLGYAVAKEWNPWPHPFP